MNVYHVPNVCIIIISEFDIFKKKRMIYHTGQCIKETGEFVNDGEERIYVNTKYADNSETSMLMKSFLCKQVDQSKYPNMHDRIKFLKETKKGVNSMCNIMQEIVEEEIMEKDRENAIRMLKDGISIYNVSKYLTLELNYVKQLKEQIDDQDDNSLDMTF